MAPLSVSIKHAGKTYAVELDPDLPPKAFKEAIYQVTGVPVDRMKVMVKTGVLKDDAQWSKINPKANQTFTVIGAAGELPKPPEKPIVFLEDMDDTELAEALAKPVGLRNLGNTCYMNATLQAMRAIPELQTALNVEKPTPALGSASAEGSNDMPGLEVAQSTPAAGPRPVLAALPAALGSLYSKMVQTADTVAPIAFLNLLREVNPQFAERDRGGHSHNNLMGGVLFAQQDADECLTTIVQSLSSVPGQTTSGELDTNKKFVEQFMTGRMVRTLKPADASIDEPTSTSSENVLKITCNIDGTVNFMASGIQKSLSQTVVKRSPTLGRDADYQQESRMTRLPAYLFVHMARFSWRADINKKAKIMRKVKFPTEYDALDLCSDELKAKLLPVSRKLKALEKERDERRKVRRKTKVKATAAPATTLAPAAEGDVEMGEASASAAAADQGGDLEAESAYRARELTELEGLIDASLKSDVGANVTGLYDLVGIVTHKGAAADAGHYIGYVKKSVFHAPVLGEETEGDEDWYKFDDDKVSLFPANKLATLDGGGEDSSAYVLLYKAKPLA
ncbi:Ubiquitin carboxyl-terminal hydrolase [Mycena indigotica]|uniref:Ubiquitin carboxyl-terminal hydrolase n=1 Tax=Mycena indigotica TaxID=2126181 RepID=A0A8H6SE49_9AGAR|nr:Ubiquitin carboxyl-terminal hydrolase [Mycena indigotica]KAF7297278.1 Ubiquitin carboxyl-terminal hydrolase [Mycena indigotica]